MGYVEDLEIKHATLAQQVGSLRTKRNLIREHDDLRQASRQLKDNDKRKQTGFTEEPVWVEREVQAGYREEEYWETITTDQHFGPETFPVRKTRMVPAYERRMVQEKQRMPAYESDAVYQARRERELAEAREKGARALEIAERLEQQYNWKGESAERVNRQLEPLEKELVKTAKLLAPAQTLHRNGVPLETPQALTAHARKETQHYGMGKHYAKSLENFLRGEASIRDMQHIYRYACVADSALSPARQALRNTLYQAMRGSYAAEELQTKWHYVEVMEAIAERVHLGNIFHAQDSGIIGKFEALCDGTARYGDLRALYTASVQKNHTLHPASSVLYAEAENLKRGIHRFLESIGNILHR